MKALHTLLILFIPFIGFGQAPISHTIYASPYNVFSPSDLTINLGDTIYFDNLTNHNAVEVSEDTYDNNGIESNGGFELYSDNYIVLDEVGTHYYVCTPHVQMEMKGKIIVTANYFGQWYTDNNFDGDEEYTIINEEYIEIIVPNYDNSGNIECYDYDYLFYLDSLNSFYIDNGFGLISVEYLAEGDSLHLSSTMIGQASFIVNDDDISGFINCEDLNSWTCDMNECYNVENGIGEYQSLEECEANCSATSINETLINVNIYPNPSSNIFNLEFNSDSKSEIIVTNVLGEQVYFESTKSIGEFNTQVDLSNYSKGIYNLTIKTSDGISNHKLILQ
jgi:plastocyanin